jgi:hypothetical protein
MSDESIPFTEGPLKQWPFWDEYFEQRLQERAPAIGEGSEFLAWATPILLAGMEQFFQSTQGHIGVENYFCLECAPKVETLIRDTERVVQSISHRLLQDHGELEILRVAAEWKTQHGEDA